MYDAYLSFAEELADASGAEVLKYFRRPLDVESKADTSPVTIADRQSEKAMRDLIEKRFPSHGIVGEEFGKKDENAEFVWVLDPIDGTKSFITGSPLFGTLIALLHNGEPVVGVINQPYIRERWTGAKGEPSRFNGREIHTRKCESLEKSAVFSTGGRLMFKNPDDYRRFESLSKPAAVTRFSADCYAYGLLAMGCVDIVCEAGMKLYDYAALIPVVTGAGGVMTDWNGKALGTDSDGHVLALGDARLLDAALKALNS